MDLFGPNPHLLANHMHLPIYDDSAPWPAMHKRKTKMARVKRSSGSAEPGRRKNGTHSADKKVEFLLLSPDEGLGHELPTTSAPLPPTPQRRTSLIHDADATDLSEEFLTQNGMK